MLIEVQVLGSTQVFYATDWHFSVVWYADHFSSVHLWHVFQAHRGMQLPYRNLSKECHFVDNTVRRQRGKARRRNKLEFHASRTASGGLRRSVDADISRSSLMTPKSLSLALSHPAFTPGSHSTALSPSGNGHVLFTFRFMSQLASFMQPRFELKWIIIITLGKRISKQPWRQLSIPQSGARLGWKALL